MSLDVYLLGAETRQTRFNDNITHNLTTMAREAGLYDALWCPDDLGAVCAGDLIPHLREGLTLLSSCPTRFSKFNPSNGWGDYANLVEFTEEYLGACRDMPTARIRISK